MRSNAMKCRHAKRKLSEFLDGVLPPAEELGLREHLEQCPDCRRELELLRKTVAALRSLPQQTPPQKLPEQIHAALARSRPAKHRLFTARTLQTAAAAALLVFLGVYGFFMRELARRPVPEQTLSEPTQPPIAADADRPAGADQKTDAATAKSAALEPAARPERAAPGMAGYAPASPAEIPEKQDGLARGLQKKLAMPAATALDAAASAQAEEKKQEAVLYEDAMKATEGTEKEYAERMREKAPAAKEKSAIAKPMPPIMQSQPPAAAALSAMPAAEHFRKETTTAEAAIPAQEKIELTLESADIPAVRSILAQYAPLELDGPAGQDAAGFLRDEEPGRGADALRRLAGAAAAEPTPQAERKAAPVSAISVLRHAPSEKYADTRVFTARVPAAEYQQLLGELRRLGRLSAPELPHPDAPAGEQEILIRLTVKNP